MKPHIYEVRLLICAFHDCRSLKLIENFYLWKPSISTLLYMGIGMFVGCISINWYTLNILCSLLLRVTSGLRSCVRVLSPLGKWCCPLYFIKMRSCSEAVRGCHNPLLTIFLFTKKKKKMLCFSVNWHFWHFFSYL